MQFAVGASLLISLVAQRMPVRLTALADTRDAAGKICSPVPWTVGWS